MSYQSDLTDAEYELIKSHFSVRNYGNCRKHEVRLLVNAVPNVYYNETGKQIAIFEKKLKLLKAYGDN